MLKYIRSIFVVFLFSFVLSNAQAASIDINTADAETLAQSISGIGPSKAQAIVDYRTTNGPFASIDDLVKVQGIGFKTLDSIRDFVIVGSAAASGASTTPSSPAEEQPALPIN